MSLRPSGTALTRGALAALFCLAAVPTAGAAGGIVVSFERVVQDGDPLPGRPETFSSFHTPALDGDRVGFIGEAFLGPAGIHVASPAGMVTIADTETQIPGAPAGQTFVGFSNPSLDGGSVAFTGARDVSGFRFEGVLVHDGESLSVVARNGDATPGDPLGSYIFFFTVALDDGAVGFMTGTTRGWEIHSTLGGLHVVVDESTIIPGTSQPFPNFGFNPTFHAGLVGLSGGSGFPAQLGGVYLAGESLLRVADVNEPIPGGVGNFTEFLDGPTTRSGRMAFRARGADNQLGIYLYDLDGALALVADRATPIPGGTGTFLDLDASDYEGPALDACGDVAFEGLAGPGQKGIYALLGPPVSGLVKVVDVDDVVDGKDLTALAIGREAFDAGRIVLVAGFADGSRGIYLATLRFADGRPVCPDPLFADGFESGDSSAWSATIP